MLGLFNAKAKTEDIEHLNAELLEACHDWAISNPMGDVPPIVRIYDALKAGADPNAVTTKGETPLLLVSRKRGSWTIARYLIARGAWVNAGMPDGDTPLLRAAAAADDDMMRVLLENDADIHAQKHEPSRWVGAPDLKLDIYHFIVVNKHDESEALRGPRRNCMKMIMDRGLPVTEDFFIYIAKPHFHDLFPGMPGARELDDAVELNDLARVNEILATGLRPDIAADFRADQALFTATTMGNIEIMDALIAAGADINLLSPQSNLTPLQRAAWAGQKEAFDHLLELGADPGKLGGGTGDTILSVAKAAGGDMEQHVIDALAHQSLTAQQPIAVKKPLQLGKKN